MKVREIINKIVESNDNVKMRDLQDVIEDMMSDLKESHESMYHKYKMCMYKIAYGERLNDEMAEHIVKDMKPAGEHWNIDETNNVMRQYNINDINNVDFYVVMNSAYNDYHELFEDDIESYIKYTRLFILDPDAADNKVFKYFTKLMKED